MLVSTIDIEMTFNRGNYVEARRDYRNSAKTA